MSTSSAAKLRQPYTSKQLKAKSLLLFTGEAMLVTLIS